MEQLTREEEAYVDLKNSEYILGQLGYPTHAYVVYKMASCLREFEQWMESKL